MIGDIFGSRHSQDQADDFQGLGHERGQASDGARFDVARMGSELPTGYFLLACTGVRGWAASCLSWELFGLRRAARR